MAKAEPPKRPVLPDRAILSALDVLGADPAMLTDEERRSLDEQGFVNLGQLLTLDQTREMKRRLRKQLAREGEAAGTEVHQEGGADRLSNFNSKPEMNHDGLFDIPLSHPKLLAAMRHVLGDLFAPQQPKLPPGQPWARSSVVPHRLGRESTGATDAARIPGVQFHLASGRIHPRERPDTRSAREPSDWKNISTADEGSRGNAPRGGVLHWAGGYGVLFQQPPVPWRHAQQHRLPPMAIHGYFTRRHHGQQLDQQQHIQAWNYDRLSQTPKGRAILAVMDVKDPEAELFAKM